MVEVFNQGTTLWVEFLVGHPEFKKTLSLPSCSSSLIGTISLSSYGIVIVNTFLSFDSFFLSFFLFDFDRLKSRDSLFELLESNFLESDFFTCSGNEPLRITSGRCPSVKSTVLKRCTVCRRLRISWFSPFDKIISHNLYQISWFQNTFRWSFQYNCSLFFHFSFASKCFLVTNVFVSLKRTVTHSLWVKIYE